MPLRVAHVGELDHQWTSLIPNFILAPTNPFHPQSSHFSSLPLRQLVQLMLPDIVGARVWHQVLDRPTGRELPPHDGGADGVCRRLRDHLDVVLVVMQNAVLLDDCRQVCSGSLEARDAVLRQDNPLVVRRPQRLAVILDDRERLRQITAAQLPPPFSQISTAADFGRGARGGSGGCTSITLALLPPKSGSLFPIVCSATAVRVHSVWAHSQASTISQSESRTAIWAQQHAAREPAGGRELCGGAGRRAAGRGEAADGGWRWQWEGRGQTSAMLMRWCMSARLFLP